MREKIRQIIDEWFADNYRLSDTLHPVSRLEGLTDRIIAVVEEGAPPPDLHNLRSAYEDFHS